MPRQHQTCCICNKTIQILSSSRPITPQQQHRLQAFASRPITPGTDRCHHKCYVSPHTNKEKQVQPRSSMGIWNDGNMEHKYAIHDHTQSTIELETLADAVNYMQDDDKMELKCGNETEIDGHLAAAPLHCLLGIVKKSIDIITQECITLDEAANHVDAGSINYIFTDMRNTLRAIQEAHDSISKWDGYRKQWEHQHLTNVSFTTPADSSAMTSYVHIQRAHQQQQQLLHQHQQHLTLLEQQWQQQKGPFTAALDDVISSIGVHRQAYHGGSFLGNDCLKLLRNASKIADVLRPRTLSIKPTSTQRPRRRASSHLSHSPPQEIKKVFSSYQSSQRAYTLLHKTKQIFDLAYAARPLCKHEQVVFMMRACSFGCWFPRAYPNETITPKMHITIFEMTKLLQRYGTIGMFSEQAIESLHAVFNKLNRQHVSMKCDEKRIEAVMKKTWIFHHPAIQSQ